ncbi:hypothetical protein LTR53_018464, partial [Teratosphaeriaceae sp. CCFEE 6253]
MLFHLAHIVTQMDIIDAQIFAGARWDRGRKVSEQDRALARQRMYVWSRSSSSKDAVLHAFRLLHETFAPDRQPLWPSASSRYSCRADPLIYRPWAVYLAGLAVWSY